MGVRDCLRGLATSRAEDRRGNMGRLEDCALAPRGGLILDQNGLGLVFVVAPDESRFIRIVQDGPPRVHDENGGSEVREGVALGGHGGESEESSHANRLADSTDAVK